MTKNEQTQKAFTQAKEPPNRYRLLTALLSGMMEKSLISPTSLLLHDPTTVI